MIRAPIVQFCGFGRARWPGDRHGVAGAALFIFVVVSEESPGYVVSQVRDAWRVYNACTPEIGYGTVEKPHPAAGQYGHRVHDELVEQPLLQGLPQPRLIP